MPLPRCLLRGIRNFVMVAPYAVGQRTVRYTVIGGVCAVANNVVMIVGSYAGYHYVPMSLVAFVLVTPIGYFLHAQFTFKVRLSYYNFFRFAMAVGTALPLYFVLMAALCSGLGMAVIFAVPIVTVTLYIWNYVLAHWSMRDRISAYRETRKTLWKSS